jgi:hypothetical protein
MQLIGGFSRALLVAVAISLTSPALAFGGENPYGTPTIDPAAPGEVILRVRDGDRSARFTYRQLLAMPSSTISIYEPFLKKRQKFTVIPLKNIFARVGISGDDRVVTKALNDYIFTASAQEFIDAQGYLAIKRDGAAIAYDQGGPIRIIFPDKSKWAKKLEAWNWSIATINVK